MQTEFFLAANSGQGFYSLYDEFPGEGNFLHIIKGGPGTGKSGFMRKIAKRAEELNMDAELIYCSGDPMSLDGLYIPAIKQAWMDGTAPHVGEPKIFGADSDYVNLGEFCKVPLSSSDSVRAGEINRRYKAVYASAYSFLAAEAAVAGAFETEPLEPEQLSRMEEIISDIISGEMGRNKKRKGAQRRRFISAISCSGNVKLEDSVKKLCKQDYQFADPLHAHQLLTLSARIASRLGAEAILCPEPLRPERLEAVLLPGLGICFAASGPDCEKPGMTIHFGNEKRRQGRQQSESPIKQELRRQATELLAQAKLLHDELETVYRPYMDFAALDKFTEAFIEKTFK